MLCYKIFLLSTAYPISQQKIKAGLWVITQSCFYFNATNRRSSLAYINLLIPSTVTTQALQVFQSYSQRDKGQHYCPPDFADKNNPLSPG
jgi:hypothetical protein